MIQHDDWYAIRTLALYIIIASIIGAVLIVSWAVWGIPYFTARGWL